MNDRRLLHQRLDREHDTIGRRPIHLVFSFTSFDRTKWVMECERVARSALLAIRSNDRNLAQRLGGSYQTLEAVGENSIVVRTEETHQW